MRPALVLLATTVIAMSGCAVADLSVYAYPP